MNMTREQLEAWCALEGLRLCGFQSGGRYRVVPSQFVSGKQRANILCWDEGSGRDWWIQNPLQALYYPMDWTELPEAAYNSLTVELLLSIKE